MKVWQLTIALLAVAAGAGCNRSGLDYDAKVVAGERLGAAADWAVQNGDGDETGYSKLDQIGSDTVGRLGLAWSLDLPGETSLEGTPLAVGGVLYFTGTHSEVYAADGKTGRLLWKYDPEVWKHNPAKMPLNFAVNRGAAYDGGKVFVATFDGRLIAIDAKTGKALWSTETISPTSTQWISGTPRAFRGKVVIGQSGADNGERGYVTAYDQNTGKQLWRFYTAPGTPEQNNGDPLMEKAAATWEGEWWKTKMGGGPWGPMTFDAETNRLYIGSANPGPIDTANRWRGKGDNLYTSSIIALDADTGKYIWHYQVNPRDSWDYGSTAQMTLADLIIDGKPRKVLMQAPKNGFLYVIDRTNGEFISAGKIVKVTWADHIDPKSGRPVEAANIRFEKGDVVIWPNPIGGHNWQAQAFSPRTGLLYIPAMHNGVRYSKDFIPGGVHIAGMWLGSEKRDARDGKGSLVAWDPVAQKEVWRVMHDNIWNGGALATAGDLVFQGTALGKFDAYAAKTGKQLWSFDAGLGIIAAPMSYAIDGKQYVAILVGWGGSASIGSDVMNVGWKYGAQPRRLLVFALDGKAKLPPSPGRDLAVHAVDDPAIKIDPAAAEAGKPLFLACALCHGRDVISSGAPAPDLRESQLALDPDAFLQVVKGGVRMEHGMPRYDQLSREQVLQIYSYVRQEARRAATGPHG